MANRGVWAGSDDLVIFFNGHHAAPVPAKRNTCPNGQGGACDGERQASVGNSRRGWNESPGQRPDGEPGLKEHKREYKRGHVDQKRGAGLNLGGPFGADRGGGPNDEHGDPGSVDVGEDIGHVGLHAAIMLYTTCRMQHNC